MCCVFGQFQYWPYPSGPLDCILDKYWIWSICPEAYFRFAFHYFIENEVE